MSVFIRLSKTETQDNVSSASPTLAMLCRLLDQRMPMQRGEALSVTADTYANAEAEMTAIYQSRGYYGIARASIPQHNFLLFGVPIVAESDCDG